MMAFREAASGIAIMAALWFATGLSVSAQTPVGPASDHHPDRFAQYKEYPLRRISGSKPVWMVRALGAPYAEGFAALAEELHEFCDRPGTRRLALYRALGIPDNNTKDAMYLFAVTPSDVFRPCFSGDNVSSSTCKHVLADHPDGEATAFAAKYWNDTHPKRGGEKFQFTGLGWTADLTSSDLLRPGVTEFVLRSRGRIQEAYPDPKAYIAITVDEFCEHTGFDANGHPVRK